LPVLDAVSLFSVCFQDRPINGQSKGTRPKILDIDINFDIGVSFGIDIYFDIDTDSLILKNIRNAALNRCKFISETGIFYISGRFECDFKYIFAHRISRAYIL